jgi:hypothetical protein
MPRTFENLAHCCVRLAHNCPDQKTSHELDAISAELMEEAAESPTDIVDSPAADIAAPKFHATHLQVVPNRFSGLRAHSQTCSGSRCPLRTHSIISWAIRSRSSSSRLAKPSSVQTSSKISDTSLIVSASYWLLWNSRQGMTLVNPQRCFTVCSNETG